MIYFIILGYTLR